MADDSHLDSKYFIDGHVFNCPFCNRRNVAYDIERPHQFDWSTQKECYIYIAKCRSCDNESMHLSFQKISLTRAC